MHKIVLNMRLDVFKNFLLIKNIAGAAISIVMLATMHGYNYGGSLSFANNDTAQVFFFEMTTPSRKPRYPAEASLMVYTNYEGREGKYLYSIVL